MIFSLFLNFLFSCQTKETKNYMRLTRGEVSIIDESANKFVSADSKIELLVDSLFLAEGPLWVDKINSLLFTTPLTIF